MPQLEEIAPRTTLTNRLDVNDFIASFRDRITRRQLVALHKNLMAHIPVEAQIMQRTPKSVLRILFAKPGGTFALKINNRAKVSLL